MKQTVMPLSEPMSIQILVVIPSPDPNDFSGAEGEVILDN